MVSSDSSSDSLYRYWASSINSEVRRFLQQDPLGPTRTDQNLYTYVHNRPVILTDPLGLYAGLKYEPLPPSGCDYYSSRTGDEDWQKANQCCRDFGDSFTANCVRGCLIAFDATFCADRADPEARRKCRLLAHVSCYQDCNATPLLFVKPASCNDLDLF
jgi:RHS repeat-associated protein